ncbi:MAG: FeoB-associated Cys-rich membrane protein [Oscillospiraceae bacterium]|jgi:hypothetical protein|nr:FeoB-associated Cys-rich membrane protein [Oscillospiraceae bacterium]
MLTFIGNNLGTIITAALVLAVVTAITLQMLRNKRKGKSIACDCGCDACDAAAARAAK